MSHDHNHSGARAGERYKPRLIVALVLIAGFFLVEVIAGFATHSLALISDAGHMLTDVVGIGMALAAIQVASQGTSAAHRTFGLYRLEILAALMNTILLFGVAAYVLIEAVGRLYDPVDVLSGPMLVVAIVGLVINVVAFALLRTGAQESLNVQGAYLEVLADTLGSVGVIVAATIVATTGWQYADPIIAAGIGLFILPRAWHLGRKALRILLQSAPPGVDLAGMASDLGAIPNVVDIHDLHMWTLTSDMDVFSAHVMITDPANSPTVLDRARQLLSEKYGIRHATLQVEPSDHRGCDQIDW